MIPRNGKRQRRYAPRRAHQRSDPRRIARARQELAEKSPAPAPASQATALLPKYCAHCRVIRLSSEDWGGLCMYCREDLEQQGDRGTNRVI